MAHGYVLAAVLAFASVAAEAFAQHNVPPVPIPDRPIDAAERRLHESLDRRLIELERRLEASIRPMMVPPIANPDSGESAFAPSSDLALARNEFDAAYLRHLTQSLAIRERAFAWHSRSTVIIFWTVFALVGCGLLLSIIQFLLAYRAFDEHARLMRAAAVQGNGRSDAGPAMPQTNLKASFQGIEISSSVLGVVILALSFLFFYLYVTQVYPIIEVGDRAASPAAEAASR